MYYNFSGSALVNISLLKCYNLENLKIFSRKGMKKSETTVLLQIFGWTITIVTLK